MQGAKKELEAKSHMDLALHPLQAIAPTAPQGSTLNSAVRHTSARWKAGTEAHLEFPNDFDLLLSIRSLHLIRRIFAAVAGLQFRLSGCYPAKLLFGLLQLSAEALDKKIMLRSHIDLRSLNILMSWNECSIQGVTHITHSRGSRGLREPLESLGHDPIEAMVRASRPHEGTASPKLLFQPIGGPSISSSGVSWSSSSPRAGLTRGPMDGLWLPQPRQDCASAPDDEGCQRQYS